MTEEIGKNRTDAPEQDAGVAAALPNLVFTINADALDNMTLGEWAAFNDPEGDPHGFVAALKRVTTGLDVASLRIVDLPLVATRIGEALEAARAPKNSG